MPLRSIKGQRTGVDKSSNFKPLVEKCQSICVMKKGHVANHTEYLTIYRVKVVRSVSSPFMFLFAFTYVLYLSAWIFFLLNITMHSSPARSRNKGQSSAKSLKMYSPFLMKD